MDEEDLWKLLELPEGLVIWLGINRAFNDPQAYFRELSDADFEKIESELAVVDKFLTQRGLSQSPPPHKDPWTLTGIGSAVAGIALKTKWLAALDVPLTGGLLTIAGVVLTGQQVISRYETREVERELETRHLQYLQIRSHYYEEKGRRSV